MDVLFAEKSKREVTQLNEDTIKDLAIYDIADNIADNETIKHTTAPIIVYSPTDKAWS